MTEPKRIDLLSYGFVLHRVKVPLDPAPQANLDLRFGSSWTRSLQATIPEVALLCWRQQRTQGD